MQGDAFKYNIQIEGDLTLNSGGIRDANVVSVKGKTYIGETGGANTSIYSNYVRLGDIIGINGGYLWLDNARTAQGIADPNFSAGTVTSADPNKGTKLCAKQNKMDGYYNLKGVNGKCGISYQTSNWTDYKKTATFTFLNTQSFSSTSGIEEANEKVMVNGIKSDSDGLSIVMKGADNATQSFTSQYLKFHKGVQVVSGNLRLNFAQYKYDYFYYRDSNMKIKATAVADGASINAAQWSHGDLTMKGGSFGSADGYGSFRFTNINYTDGEIELRLNSETQKDTIDLTAFYESVTNSETNTTTVEKVDGGTIVKEGDAPIKFNFVGDLTWLKNFLENEMGTRIISWDSSKKPDELLTSDFAANTFSDGENTYKANFSINGDGLYVKYVAVPEPATVAAIFGALALAFAAYRRRK